MARLRNVIWTNMVIGILTRGDNPLDLKEVEAT